MLTVCMDHPKNAYRVFCAEGSGPDPCGNLVDYTYDASVEDNPFRFSTKYWDEETGLYYYGYRYYSPGVASFLSRDFLELGGNLTRFVENDPVGLVDVNGLVSFGVWEISIKIYDILGGGVTVRVADKAWGCCTADGTYLPEGMRESTLKWKAQFGFGLGVDLDLMNKRTGNRQRFALLLQGPTVALRDEIRAATDHCGGPLAYQGGCSEVGVDFELGVSQKLPALLSFAIGVNSRVYLKVCTSSAGEVTYHGCVKYDEYAKLKFWNKVLWETEGESRQEVCWP